MRILIVSTFFPPLNSIASLRPYSWAKYWTEAGHDVTVLTTKKESDTTLQLPNNGFTVEEITMPAFTRSLKKPQEQSTKKPNRFLHYLRFKKGIFNACRMPDLSDLWIAPAWRFIKDRGRWDLIVSTAGPYSVHIIAERMKRKGLGKKWIADFRDTWSNNYIYPGLFPLNIIERLLEKKLMHAADCITTVSDPFADSLASIHKQSQVSTIENGFDPSDLLALDPEPVFPNEKKFRIVHTGSIYLGKRDPTPLFEAIWEMKKDPLLDSLEVIFAGSRQANLREVIERYQVSRWVKLVGQVDRETALRMQRDAHSLLFLPWTDPSVNGVLTGKLFEYLYSGTPLVAVGGRGMEASQELIVEANAGVLLRNVDEIKRYLRDALSQLEKRRSAADPSVLERYDRKLLAMRMLNLADDP